MGNMSWNLWLHLRSLKWEESVISLLMDCENGGVVCIFPAMWVSDDP